MCNVFDYIIRILHSWFCPFLESGYNRKIQIFEQYLVGIFLKSFKMQELAAYSCKHKIILPSFINTSC